MTGMKFQITQAVLELIPVTMRLPLKFGAETVDSITCARVRIEISDGVRSATGIGETPISVAWGWPSKTLGFAYREERMLDFCRRNTEKWRGAQFDGHAIEFGRDFFETSLFEKESELPRLAQLICGSAPDIALHDAFGRIHGLPTYKTYNARFMRHDLAWFYGDESFSGKYPEDFFVKNPPDRLPVWHLVGGKDCLESDPAPLSDGYPTTLTEWIRRDGLKYLKIKLTGTDAVADYERLADIGEIALRTGVDWLSPDFNCLVADTEYVNGILDRLKDERPAVYGKLLYVEQPFAYNLEDNPLDVHSVSSRKPLFMDESAHDWRVVRRGFELGWNGVALKVCKTQTGALLSACWAKAHGMGLMVQDLTNPMYAMAAHVQLARHIGTIMGVECNAPQFYPAVSEPYEKKYPGLYERREGRIDLSALGGTGFGME